MEYRYTTKLKWNNWGWNIFGDLNIKARTAWMRQSKMHIRVKLKKKSQ